MRFVYITQGEHFSNPGRPITAHATETRAIMEAVSLVNIMLKDDGQKDDANAGNWEARIASLQDKHGAQYCYVEITQLPILGTEHLPDGRVDA